MKKIDIAKDYSTTPGPRLISQGEFSGELFRDTILEPAYLEAKKNKEKVTVILDGTFGYYDSFLEESFGGLKRKYQKDDVFNFFIFISNEEPDLIEKIRIIINEALNKKR